MAPPKSDRPRPFKGQQLNFITFDHPSEGKAQAVRKKIRSHVTSRQHRITREGKEVASLASTEKERDTCGSRSRSRPVVDDEEERDIEHCTSKPGVDNEKSTDSSIASRELDYILEETKPGQRQSHSLQSPGTMLSVEAILRSGPLASRASRTSILHDPSDRIAGLLGRLGLNFTMVMDHYNWIVATQAKDFEAHFMSDMEPGSGFQTLVPAISNDPALTATAVLIAAGHILAIRNVPMSQNTANCIYQLRSFVIAHLNAAIQDPRRATSDPLLVAVLIIASHEGLQGSVTNYHIHMRGLVQMINMRGGLHKLDESQRYLKKMIIWQDTNVATIMKCKPYHLLADDSANAPVVVPNPRLWLLMDAKPP